MEEAIPWVSPKKIPNQGEIMRNDPFRSRLRHDPRQGGKLGRTGARDLPWTAYRNTDGYTLPAKSRRKTRKLPRGEGSKHLPRDMEACRGWERDDLRFVDFGGTERTVTVNTPYLHLAGVWQTDAVERGHTTLQMVGDNEFQFAVHPHEIVTIRLTQLQR